MADITVVGGGLAGLVASIACAEAGAQVHLYEAHATLGGRARSTPPPFIAQDGPHVLYDDGPLWAWLAERDLNGPAAHPPLGALAGLRFRQRGTLRRRPPLSILRLLAHPRRTAPVDRDFHGWVAESYGEEAARAAGNLMGVATFDADPGRLSAAFVWERMLRVFGSMPPPARYVIGGWSSMLARMDARARRLGVAIELGSRVDRLPGPPVIVATSLEAARPLLGDDALRWDSGRAMLLDLGLRHRGGDAFVIADLDEAGWAERYSAPDPTVAPPGHSLVQAQLPLRQARPGPAGCGGWSACSTSATPAGATGRCGAGTPSPTPARARSTCPAAPGGTGQGSSAGMASFWPATWSRRRACSARSPSTAP